MKRSGVIYEEEGTSFDTCIDSVSFVSSSFVMGLDPFISANISLICFCSSVHVIPPRFTVFLCRKGRRFFVYVGIYNI